jgi:hypothetical protein
VPGELFPASDLDLGRKIRELRGRRTIRDLGRLVAV